MLTLEQDVIQVWAARLDCSDEVLAELQDVLSPDERNRAEKFVFARDRRKYIAARGTLRNILAEYTKVAPESLIFEYNCEGKPSLSADCGGDWLGFNVAHSGSLALYGLRLEGEVGVDIEQVRPLEDLWAIAASTFSAAENIDLQSLLPHQYQEAFFKCWTRKEAFIKAVGTGLSYPLKEVDVTLRPGEPARFLRIEGGDPGKWSLIDLHLAAGYAAAVAAPASDVRVKWSWWAYANLMVSKQP